MRPSQHASHVRFGGLLVTALAAIVPALALTACASLNGPATGGEVLPTEGRWVASWGAAQQIPDTANELAAANWRDGSLRQTVRLSLGGGRLRVRLSNVHGTAPLMVEGASVALALAPGKAQIDGATSRTLTFDGTCLLYTSPSPRDS